MWNCSAPSSLLLPSGDDYLKCENSSSPAGAVGLDKILAAEYDLCHTLNLSPSLQSLQTPTIFAMHGSEGCYLGIGANPIYSGEARPAFAQFSCTQTTTAAHSVKWTAAGTATTGDSSRLRGSKRLKTTATATAQGPQHGLQCNAKPRNQPVKAPCKRSQKLGDKITALQQLVSPYGKTDTASVLHETATCIKRLHELIQILTASYPEIGSPASQQDTGEEEGATGLHRRGLCLAPLSPAVVRFVASEAAHSHRDTADAEDRWRLLGTL
ncbi:transcription factor bHLH111-like [Phragmites australis]|uniref:transcription factor bHLH111-like n=1 Tax=Phragmites australis TaxID=29695 RepID=UPI002D76DD19|nr:transcription factor bHLH111-like [Phragmites australis]